MGLSGGLADNSGLSVGQAEVPTSGLPGSAVLDSAVTPHGVDSTGVGDRGRWYYNSAAGRWKASAGGPIDVLDKRYNGKGDGVSDETVAINGAITDANAAAASNRLVDVILPPGYGFKFGQLTPKPNVRLVCDGTYMLPNFTAMGDVPALKVANNTAISQFQIHGGYWDGSLSTTVNQQLFYIGSGGSGIDLVFRDMFAPANWASSLLYLRNVQRTDVLGNKFLGSNMGGFGSYFNTVNFVGDAGGQQLQGLRALGNYFDQNGSASIAIVCNQLGNLDLKAIIAHNISTGLASSTSTIAGSLDFESGAAGGNTYYGVAIVNNDVEFVGADAGANAAINVSPGTAAVSDFLIGYNRVKSTSGGIRYAGGVTVKGNRINSSVGKPFKVLAGGEPGTDNRISNPAAGTAPGPMSGRVSLVAGTVTINTNEVVALDNIILTRVGQGGTIGNLQVGPIVAGTSFVINSVQPGTTSTLQTLDTSTVYWRIDH